MSKKKGHGGKPKKRGSGTLVADTSDSTCFADLRYKGGSVYMTFTDGSQDIIDGMTKADAQDWFDADSLGGYYNDVYRNADKNK